MANDFPSLLIYTPITADNTFIEDISPYVTNYSHSIRLLGGYWTAQFKLAYDDIGKAMYQQWKTNRFFYHMVEEYRGQTSWEGSIEGIQVDDDSGTIDITAYGYVHSIQNQYNSTTDTALVNADAWLKTMIATDCEFIQEGDIEENTLQVYQAGTDKVWSEMLKVVELGDNGSPATPYSLMVMQDRRLNYQKVSTTPLGYVRGGIRWRIDGINDIVNRVIVRYTDETGASTTDIFNDLPESEALFGIRELRLQRYNMPTASASALSGAYKYAHCWPTRRAIGSSRNIQVYDTIGANAARSPWLIMPGVYQDTTLMNDTELYYSWLPAGAFLADEVVASAEGIQFKTSDWDESDALDAYYDYLGRAPKAKDKKSGRRKRGAGSGGSGSQSTGSGSSGGSGGSSGGSTGGTGGGRREPPKDLPT